MNHGVEWMRGMASRTLCARGPTHRGERHHVERLDRNGGEGVSAGGFAGSAPLAPPAASPSSWRMRSIAAFTALSRTSDSAERGFLTTRDDPKRSEMRENVPGTIDISLNFVQIHIKIAMRFLLRFPFGFLSD